MTGCGRGEHYRALSDDDDDDEARGRLIYLTSSMYRGGSTDLSRLAAGTGSYSDSKLWVTVLSAAFVDRLVGNHQSRSRPRLGAHPYGRRRRTR